MAYLDFITRQRVFKGFLKGFYTLVSRLPSFSLVFSLPLVTTNDTLACGVKSHLPNLIPMLTGNESPKPLSELAVLVGSVV
jgi:hypothetical protein